MSAFFFYVHHIIIFLMQSLIVIRRSSPCRELHWDGIFGVEVVIVYVFAASTIGTFDLQSSRVLVLKRLDYAVLDLVLRHLAQRFQLRFRRLPKPAEHLHSLAVLGRSVSVARPASPLYLHDPRQRGWWLII